MEKRAKILAMFLVALVMASTATGEIIFVDADANGLNDGSSWADAFNDLQDALTVASSGDEIRAAQGIYKPDQGVGITPGDGMATFQLVNGVILKGGYAGFDEPDSNARDIDMYETILSGDLNGDDEPNFANIVDNSWHIVTSIGTDETAILDGFTVTAGYAYVDHACGAGMYNENSNPKVTNCTFKKNYAGYIGGGMYNDGGSPRVANCTFSGNSSGLGGGIGNDNNSSTTITNCTFIDNTARWGGGIFNFESTLTLTDCTFIENSADYGGGGLDNSSRSPRLTNCTFIGNSASYGGGIFSAGPGTTIIDCTFNYNSAELNGGGIRVISWDRSTLTNCAFNGNWASNGGGIHNRGDAKLTNCLFNGNRADYGGGMYNASFSPMLMNCIFSGNSASYGGGIYNDGSPPMGHPAPFIDVTTSDDDQMGILGKCSPAFNNCTFVGNSALSGNALACDSWLQQYPSNLQITNCILWDDGNEIWNNDDSAITINYSDVHGDWPGEGNIDADPLFRDPDGQDDVLGTEDDNLRLSTGSPCIDAGDPNYGAEPNETDLDGRPRVVGGRIDMGAYEAPLPAEVRINPSTINPASKGRWITCYIWLAEGYDVADINCHSLLLEYEIEPEQLWVDEKQQVVMARFSREEVQAILNIGEVELTIRIHLTDGTVFEGTNVVKVIDKDKGDGKFAKPGEASNPNPTDEATGVSIYTAYLSWTAGPYATSHDVYFGTSSTGMFQGNQSGTTFDLDMMAYYTTYYWRIDEVNKWGKTTGTVWSFRTIGAGPGGGTGP